MEQNHFFMVYVESANSPTYRHYTLESAEKEAKRLASELGMKAYVLCSLKSFEVQKFDIKDCRPSIYDLPF